MQHFIFTEHTDALTIPKKFFEYTRLGWLFIYFNFTTLNFAFIAGVTNEYKIPLALKIIKNVKWSFTDITKSMVLLKKQIWAGKMAQ